MHPSVAIVIAPIVGLAIASPLFILSPIGGYAVALAWVNILLACIFAAPVMLFVHGFLCRKGWVGYLHYSVAALCVSVPVALLLVAGRVPVVVPCFIISWGLATAVLFRALVRNAVSQPSEK